MGCPMFSKCDEIKEIIKMLLKEREDLFGDLKQFFWPEMAVYGLRTDKNAPKSQKWTLKIEGVRGPKTLLNLDSKYIIWGYKNSWDSCSEDKKIAHVANMLKRIDFPSADELQKLSDKGEDYEMGKLRKPDIQDFRSFLIAPGFGVDWADEGSIIPSLIKDKSVQV
jgi:hypothetical protein